MDQRPTHPEPTGRRSDESPADPAAEADGEPGRSVGAFYQPWADPGRDYAVRPPATSHSGPAEQVERQVLGASRWVDRLQSGFAPVAFVYAVFKKYSDDEGSRLAALLAYYTFLSLFPLAVLGFAIINAVLADRPDLVTQLVTDIVPAEYQQQVINAYTALPSSGPAFAVALIGLLLSGTGGVFSFYAMANQVFAVPYRYRFGFGPRYLRVFLVLVVGGVAVLVVTIGSAVAANVTQFAAAQRLAVFGLVWLVAALVIYFAVTVLTRPPVRFRELGLGAALGGVAVTVLMSLGSVLVGRFISTSSAIYGAFATVVGIFSVLFLISNTLVLSLEVGVVRAWRLWPRGVDIMLLFPADERAYALLTLMDERMPSQRNGLMFDAVGHDDPRRPSRAELQRRPPGVPLRPYDVPVDPGSDDSGGRRDEG